MIHVETWDDDRMTIHRDEQFDTAPYRGGEETPVEARRESHVRLIGHLRGYRNPERCIGCEAIFDAATPFDALCSACEDSDDGRP